jgi:hypothetical protein
MQKSPNTPMLFFLVATKNYNTKLEYFIEDAWFLKSLKNEGNFDFRTNVATFQVPQKSVLTLLLFGELCF